MCGIGTRLILLHILSIFRHWRVCWPGCESANGEALASPHPLPPAQSVMGAASRCSKSDALGSNILAWPAPSPPRTETPAPPAFPADKAPATGGGISGACRRSQAATRARPRRVSSRQGAHAPSPRMYREQCAASWHPSWLRALTPGASWPVDDCVHCSDDTVWFMV